MRVKCPRAFKVLGDVRGMDFADARGDPPPLGLILCLPEPSPNCVFPSSATHALCFFCAPG